MSQLKLNHVVNAETVDSRWSWLYKIGGAAALLVVVILPIQIIVYIVSPPPNTAIDYFTLFQSNSLLGLLALDLLIIVDIVLGIPLLLALYIALRRSSESFMAIALALGFLGNTAYIASNTAFNMLYLSKQYASATTDAQRSLFLAAGEAMLAIFNGTAFQLNYVLGSVVMIIISVVMLRSNIFGKVTAYMGILAGVIGFGLYVPAIGIYISIFSVVFIAIWYILIARRLFQLGQGISKAEANRIGSISR
ncbi:MAG: hypothetical protein Q8P40_12515 [Nitrospirota bacterium]|nr:hypothetical protein [Nitrospirota bacterium]